MDRRADRAGRVGLFPRKAARSRIDEGPGADPDRPPLPGPLDPVLQDLHIRDRRDRDIRLPGGPPDLPGDEVIGIGLHGRSQSEGGFPGEGGDGPDLGQAPFAPGEGTGLVEDDSRQPPGDLEGVEVPHQDPALAGQGDPGHPGQGDGDPQGAGTGDDHHGDGPEDRRVGRGPQEPEHSPRAGGQSHDGGDEPLEDPVGATLQGRLLRQGLLHDLHHLPEHGLPAHRLGRCLERPLQDHAAAAHRISRLHRHRAGLTGQGGFVHGPGPGDHPAVGGDHLPRIDPEEVPPAQGFDGGVPPLREPVGADPDLGRHQREEALQVLPDLRLGPPLQGLAQQHQGDEHGGGVEVEVDRSGEQADRAVGEGGQGARGDEGLHAETGRSEPQEGFPMDGVPAVEKDAAGQEEDGPGEVPDRLRSQVAEKARVEGEGEHHHVHGEKRGDPEADELSAPQAGLGRFVGGSGRIPQPPDGFGDGRGVGPHRVVFADQPVGREAARGGDHAGELFEGRLDNPGAGRAPHLPHLEVEAQGFVLGGGDRFRLR